MPTTAFGVGDSGETSGFGGAVGWAGTSTPSNASRLAMVDFGVPSAAEADEMNVCLALAETNNTGIGVVLCCWNE